MPRASRIGFVARPSAISRARPCGVTGAERSGHQYRILGSMYALTKSMTHAHGDDDEREDDDDPLHGRVVAVLEVDDELVADARPVERRLGQDRAAEQQREVAGRRR